MKAIKIILAILFLAFAALQYNDPDPVFWIFIYGFAALLLGLSAFGRHLRIPILIFTVLCIIYSMSLVPGVRDWLNSGDLGSIGGSMKVDKLYIEETREFFGLWMAIASLIWLYFKGKS